MTADLQRKFVEPHICQIDAHDYDMCVYGSNEIHIRQNTTQNLVPYIKPHNISASRVIC